MMTLNALEAYKQATAALKVAWKRNHKLEAVAVAARAVRDNPLCIIEHTNVILSYEQARAIRIALNELDADNWPSPPEWVRGMGHGRAPLQIDAAQAGCLIAVANMARAFIVERVPELAAMEKDGVSEEAAYLELRAYGLAPLAAALDALDELGAGEKEEE